MGVYSKNQSIGWKGKVRTSWSMEGRRGSLKQESVHRVECKVKPFNMIRV
jgi:hypothetical protein